MCKLVEMKMGNRRIRVADIKQKYIKNIADAAEQCDYIDKVILFGSSITERCTEHSDMDLAVFGNQPETKCLTSKKYRTFTRRLYQFDDHAQPYDILYFKTGGNAKSFILKDIEKGEVLYERG